MGNSTDARASASRHAALEIRATRSRGVQVILVVGATGMLGMEVCRQLTGRQTPVRAMVRQTSNAAHVEALKRMGAELVEGDLKDPATLVNACRAAEAVISTATITASRQPGDSIQEVDLQGQLSLVDAARASGVRHFVYVSYGDIDREDPCPLTVAKRTVEEHLQRSGLTFTILQPSTFMDVWLSPALGFDFTGATAQIFGSGENPISWVAVRDVAQFAVGSLTAPAAQNAALSIGGPEALSPHEVVRIFEEVGGRAFALTHIPEEALKAQRAAATDPLEQSFAALALATAAGDVIDMRGLLEVLPVDLTSVRDYARGVLSAAQVSSS